MFANIIRHHLHVRNTLAFRAGLLSRRQFSVLSNHASFPATLYRFQTQRSSGLFDYKESGDIENGLELSADGLVRPRLSDDVPFSNGAVFMPNTFTMQEWIRTSFDNYVESLEEGQSKSDAIILSVGKGTFIPRFLTLLHERSSRFSLQPSHPMKIKELNDLLSEFYRQSAIFTDAEEWMHKNEYHKSTADEDIEKWTRKSMR